jgi:hypothetical protein
MDEIQVTLNGGDALALLPLIDEQTEAQAGPEQRALWDGLYTAIKSALDADIVPPQSNLP